MREGGKHCPYTGHAFLVAPSQVRAFRGVMLEAGRVCTVRVSKGDDEMAACGQLGDVSLAKRPVPVSPPPPAIRDLLAGAQALQQHRAADGGATVAAAP